MSDSPASMRARKQAYARLIEELDLAVEIWDGAPPQFVTAHNGELLHAESGGEPVEIDAAELEQLLDNDRVDIVSLDGLYEFKEVVPDAGCW